MEFDLPYLLRVAIAITLFYLAYYLMFKREKTFLFNRFYLMSSMLISFIIPLITFTKQVFVSEVVIAVPSQVQSVASTTIFASVELFIVQIMNILFLAGFAFFLSLLLTGHFKVWRIIKKASKQNIHGHSVWVTNSDIPSFTYFGNLIIPSNILNNPHLQTVVHHEYIHAKGQHCLDICLSEVLFLFQWFNPFAWFFKKAIRNNLEYLTDNEAIIQTNQQEYQLGIVSLASNNTFYTFPSVSNKSQLKKRIIMMKKSKQTRFLWIKMLAIIPMLTILTMTLSGREVQIIRTAPTVIEETVLIIEDKDVRDIVDEENELIVDNKVVSIEVIEKKHQSAEVKAISGKVMDENRKPIAGMSVIIKGSTTGTITDLNGKFKLSNVKNDDIISFTMVGYENVEVIVGKADVINVGMGASNELNDSTLQSQSITIRNKVKDVNVYLIKNPSISEDSIMSPEVATINIRTSDSNSEPLIIIDNKPANNLILSQLDPKNIESFSVLKDQAAIANYGEAAKNGVIIITTKKADNAPVED